MKSWVVQKEKERLQHSQINLFQSGCLFNTPPVLFSLTCLWSWLKALFILSCFYRQWVIALSCTLSLMYISFINIYLFTTFCVLEQNDRETYPIRVRVCADRTSLLSKSQKGSEEALCRVFLFAFYRKITGHHLSLCLMYQLQILFSNAQGNKILKQLFCW